MYPEDEHHNNHDNEKFESALNVNKGVDQPPSTNRNSIKRFKKHRKKAMSTDDYVRGILAGDRIILSRAITLVESTKADHQKLAQEIIGQCIPYSGKSQRIGITGVPGVGKSTFIEAMGKYITGQQRKLAVLAVDPSSERSSGSILGDKTRMEELSADPNAYIRPSPTAGSLGGVARKTRESIILCEAAGFDTIFIETVGVGQSETAVHGMVDFFLLLMLAGAGDELQGIKRGIMEMADAIIITKADSGNEEKANQAKAEYQNALHLFPPADSEWTPKVITCSALYQKGLREIWQNIINYFKLVKENGFLSLKRRQQARHWMYETINESLKNHFYAEKHRKAQIKALEEEVMQGRISSFKAANTILAEYYENLSS